MISRSYFARHACLLSLLVVGLLGCSSDKASDDDSGPVLALRRTQASTWVLSKTEAPEETGEFYFGDARVTAPGFNIDAPRMIALMSDDGHLRYLGVQGTVLPEATFGDGPDDFPLTGEKDVPSAEAHIAVEKNDVNAHEGFPTAVDFRYHHTAEHRGVDMHLSFTATRTASGWSATLTANGTLYGAAIDYRAEATIRPPQHGDSSRSTWTGPIALMAPGFSGWPVDQLTLDVNGAGVPTALTFRSFFRSKVALPPADCTPVAGRPNVAPSADRFVLQHRCVNEMQGNDVVEGIEGQKVDGLWLVRYFIDGKWWKTPVHGHGFATLGAS